MSKRISILTKILEYNKSYKTAQELSSNESEIDKTTADKLASDIFEEIYDEVFRNMINELKV